ncbi:MAG TPA: DNA mismatch repair protein MutS, partial [Firmicutes bacterium]|nr:DNA mismatch repair protein MutS [Bacillota bacterium]
LLPGIKEILKETSAGLFKKMVEEVPDFTYLAEELGRAINEDASFSTREGNIFKPGYSEEADRLRKVSSESKTWMLEMEKTERERTGIRTLKIGFNKVFGYYLEVTKSYQERVPQNYIRKQTLANAERYITQELKEKEDLILRAEERLAQLESTLFQELCQKVAGYTPELQFLAGQMATLDCIFSFADVASANNYTKPCFSEDGSIKISGCRHPVVEQKGEDLFVPNDVLLDENKERIHIITGPNMAGKSTYCRSVALSLIMAQAGSFVPATTMSFMPLGRIFARVGASDDLSRGRSTFMVEMEETASILTGAANDCLIVLDEIGRGTSTFDGMSLARAILEYLHGRTGARVLFSTHYHELTALEKQLAGVKNYTVSVREEGDSIIFLRKVVPGKANRSYGINVARMAGLPREVLEQAQKFLNELEKTDSDQVLSLAENRSDDRVPSANRLQEKKGQLSLFPEVDRQVKPFTLKEQKIIEEIKALNLIKVTPLDALLKLFSLQKRLSSQALRQERDG